MRVRRNKPLYEEDRDPTLEELRQARQTIAECIKLDGPKYLPLFEYLDRLFAEQEAQDRALARALGFAEGGDGLEYSRSGGQLRVEERNEEEQADNPDRLLLPKEAAEILRVGEKTLRKLTQRGEIAFIPVGARFKRYHPDDVRAYIDRRRSCAPSPEEMKAMRKSEKVDLAARIADIKKYDFEAIRREHRAKKSSRDGK